MLVRTQNNILSIPRTYIKLSGYPLRKKMIFTVDMWKIPPFKCHFEWEVRNESGLREEKEQIAKVEKNTSPIREKENECALGSRDREASVGIDIREGEF